jgi:hypothetical protein
MDELDEEAAAIVDKATKDPVEEMERKGWRKVAENIDYAGAVGRVGSEISDSDHCVTVTKAGSNYTVWVLDWQEH